jgi:arginase
VTVRGDRAAHARACRARSETTAGAVMRAGVWHGPSGQRVELRAYTMVDLFLFSVNEESDEPMNIAAVLAPYDSGHHQERMGLGPQHLWQAIAPMLQSKGHATRADVITVPEGFLTEIATTFSVARAIAERVADCQRDGWLPLVLSGNCNASVGTVSGCGSGTTGVVWFDAHGEATTPETTRSGFLDGMGISILAGQCWRVLARSVPGFAPLVGEQIILVGARDVEPEEADVLQRLGVTQVRDVDDLRAALALLRARAGIDGVYLHIDLDVLDPREATANQWAPPGGLAIASMQAALATVRQVLPIKAVGLASYSPEIDRDGRALRAALTMIDTLC